MPVIYLDQKNLFKFISPIPMIPMSICMLEALSYFFENMSCKTFDYFKLIKEQIAFSFSWGVGGGGGGRALLKME
jgi:hypothetical protein